MLYELYWFLQDERGAAAIEYGLIASLVSVAIVTALNLAGESLRDLFNLVANAIWSGT